MRCPNSDARTSVACGQYLNPRVGNIDRVPSNSGTFPTYYTARFTSHGSSGVKNCRSKVLYEVGKIDQGNQSRRGQCACRAKLAVLLERTRLIESTKQTVPCTQPWHIGNQGIEDSIGEWAFYKAKSTRQLPTPAGL